MAASVSAQPHDTYCDCGSNIRSMILPSNHRIEQAIQHIRQALQDRCRQRRYHSQMPVSQRHSLRIERHNEASSISCHQILENVWLGNLQACMDRRHHQFNVIITACPIDTIIRLQIPIQNNITQDDLSPHLPRPSRTDTPLLELDLATTSFVDQYALIERRTEIAAQKILRTERIQWQYVGDAVGDHPDSWFSLVYNNTISHSQRHLFPSLHRDFHRFYLWRIPVTQWFQTTFRFIDQGVFGWSKVLVHCHLGISRSTTILAAYLIHRFNMTTTEALSFLKTKRACVRSRFTMQLSHYEFFLQQVRNLEQPHE